MNSALPWYVLLVPLLSAASITLLTRRWRGLSSFISVAAVLISFVGSCIIFGTADMTAREVPWIEFRQVLYVPLGFVLDGLSKTMLVLVTGVGTLIHIY